MRPLRTRFGAGAPKLGVGPQSNSLGWGGGEAPGDAEKAPTYAPPMYARVAPAELAAVGEE